jgi:hypothetical protein
MAPAVGGKNDSQTVTPRAAANDDRNRDLKAVKSGHKAFAKLLLSLFAWIEFRRFGF